MGKVCCPESGGRGAPDQGLRRTRPAPDPASSGAIAAATFFRSPRTHGARVRRVARQGQKKQEKFNYV